MRSPLVLYVVKNIAFGAVIGWGLLAALIGANTAGLRDLIFSSREWPIVLFMLMLVFGITFASLAVATAIMLLKDNSLPQATRAPKFHGPQADRPLAPARPSAKADAKDTSATQQ
jgi:hypothetical protein